MSGRRGSGGDPLLSPRALAAVGLLSPAASTSAATPSPPPHHHHHHHCQPAGATTTVDDLPDGALHAVLDLLSPRDLVIASATCKRWAALLSDAASDRAWRSFFARRWRTGDADLGGRRSAGAPPWRKAYSQRLAEAAALAPPSRPAADSLAGGHKSAARAVALLPASGLAVTGGADRVVRTWDLGAGLPMAASQPLPWAVRAVAADATALAAASGSGRRVALWRADATATARSASSPTLPWDVTRRPTYLAGHTGPVAGLALSESEGGAGSRLYSASWDCSVRVWDVGSASCVAAAPLTDWVWAALPRGGRVLCAEGRGAAVLDGETLAVVSRVPPFALSTSPPPAPGPCARVEGSRDGRTLFIAHADGGIAVHDLRASTTAPQSVLVAPGTPAFPPATGLAFDDPWLAVGLGPSGVVLLDARRRGGCLTDSPLASPVRPPHQESQQPTTRPRRLGTGAAAGGDVLGVDLAGPHLAAACASGAVLTWRWDADAAAAATAVGRRRRRQQAIPRALHRPPSALVADSWEDALMEAGAAAA